MDNNIPRLPPKVPDNVGEATFYRHKTVPGPTRRVWMITYPHNKPRIHHRGFGLDEGDEVLNQFAENAERIMGIVGNDADEDVIERDEGNGPFNN